MRLIISIAAITLLAACVPQPQSASAPPPPPRQPNVVQTPPPAAPLPPRVAGFRTPQIMQERGLEPVIRTNAATLQQMFGTAQLDVREGDMRKLQFSASACVLDVFLYPLAPGREPVATWVEARRASDGAAVDRGACVASLRRR